MSVDKKQIYILDDDESVCRALKLLLESCGFAVQTFNVPEKFIGDVTPDSPGCLILDIHMPGLDGWATLERLKTAGSEIPIIVITADKNGGLRERALKAGVEAFFQKPINDQELIDSVNQALRIKRK